MTRRRKQKQRIRARMARTGERYATARSVLLGRARTTVVGSPVVMIPVSEMPRAIAFYRDALGFSVRAKNSDDSWVELAHETVAIGLHLGGQGAADTGLGLLVADLATARRNVVRLGGRIANDDHEQGAVVPVADPDGNLLRLMTGAAGD